MTKQCNKCGEIKDVNDFYPRMNRCKKCHKNICTEWSRNNKEKVDQSRYKWRGKPGSREKEREASKRWQREHPQESSRIRLRAQVKLYGLTLEQYEQMEKQQNGCCAICQKVPDRRLDIDHNHTTGKVRSLLCSNCNTSVGLLQEDSNLAMKLVEYLQAHQN